MALPAIRYERPASSALSEFAPENRFYANQRRVEIDQINMGLAKLEWWRLCARVATTWRILQFMRTHTTRVPVAATRCGPIGPSGGSCCGSARPSPTATTPRVRIDDSAEDREPKFYVRQLLGGLRARDIREAWKLSAADVPFGFEFICPSHIP